MKFLENLTIPRTILPTLGVMPAILPGVDGIVHLKSDQVGETARASERSRQAIDAARQTLASTVNQEAGYRRGFLLAGEDRFPPADRAVCELRGQAATMRAKETRAALKPAAKPARKAAAAGGKGFSLDMQNADEDGADAEFKRA